MTQILLVLKKNIHQHVNTYQHKSPERKVTEMQDT